MPVIKRNDITAKIKEQIQAGAYQIMLLFGERFLCRKSADEIEKMLVKDEQGTVYSIDGDNEDSSQTLFKLLTFSLLPGRQIYRVTDSRLFHSKTSALSIWQKAEKAFQSDDNSRAVRYLGQLINLASLQSENGSYFSTLTAEQFSHLFDFDKPQDCSWADTLLEGKSIPQHHDNASDMAGAYTEAFTKGIPASNLLILTAENVDKRKKIFTYIKEHGLVVDCSAPEGHSMAAQRVQRSVLDELIGNMLKEHNKKINKDAREALLERIGFHPVAAVVETEKLALYCEQKDTITLEDVDTIIGRTREEALFELTDALGKKQLTKTLTILHNLLENGIHGLAILATLRNYVRRLLIIRSLQHLPQPAYSSSLNAKSFQENYLPQLKETGEWPEILKAHPYALFMSFSKAAQENSIKLKEWLALILEAEYRLKGSGLPEQLVLEHLLLNMMRRGAPSSP